MHQGRAAEAKIVSSRDDRRDGTHYCNSTTAAGDCRPRLSSTISLITVYVSRACKLKVHFICRWSASGLDSWLLQFVDNLPLPVTGAATFFPTSNQAPMVCNFTSFSEKRPLTLTVDCGLMTGYRPVRAVIGASFGKTRRKSKRPPGFINPHKYVLTHPYHHCSQFCPGNLTATSN